MEVVCHILLNMGLRDGIWVYSVSIMEILVESARGLCIKSWRWDGKALSQTLVMDTEQNRAVMAQSVLQLRVCFCTESIHLSPTTDIVWLKKLKKKEDSIVRIHQTQNIQESHESHTISPQPNWACYNSLFLVFHRNVWLCPGRGSALEHTGPLQQLQSNNLLYCLFIIG